MLLVLLLLLLLLLLLSLLLSLLLRVVVLQAAEGCGWIASGVGLGIVGRVL